MEGDLSSEPRGGYSSRVGKHLGRSREEEQLYDRTVASERCRSWHDHLGSKLISHSPSESVNGV